MTDPTNDNDIDALLRLWSVSDFEDHRRYHRALTALVAKRDALKTRVMELERELAVDTMAVIVAMRKGDANA